MYMRRGSFTFRDCREPTTVHDALRCKRLLHMEHTPLLIRKLENDEVSLEDERGVAGKANQHRAHRFARVLSGLLREAEISLQLTNGDANSAHYRRWSVVRDCTIRR